MKKTIVTKSLILLFLLAAVISIIVYLRLPRSTDTFLPGNDQVTEHEFAEGLLQFNLRSTQQAYVNYGDTSDAWNGDAMKLLDDYSRLQPGQPSAARAKEMAKQARAIISRGCNDPLILYIYGQMLCEIDNHPTAISCLRRATKLFAKSKYPRISCRLAPMRLSECLTGMNGQEKEAEAMRELALQWTADAMHDGSFRPGEQRIALCLIRREEDFYTKHEAKLLDKMAANPGDDRYVAAVLRGACLTHLAMGRRQDRKKLEQARNLLSAAWKSHPEYPEAPAQMITVAMLDESIGGKPRQWFDRSVAAQFDYADAYDRMITALMPRNGQGYDRVYAFGEQCLKSGRFDTRVPMYMFTVLEIITDDMGGERTFWKTKKTKSNLQVLFQGYEAKAAPGDQLKYKSMHAGAAWYYHNFDEAMSLLDQLGDRVNEKAFARAAGVDFARAREEIYTRAPSCAALISHAEEVCRTKGAAAGSREYRKILAKGGWSPYLTGLFNSRIAVLNMKVQYYNGNRVELLPGPELAGWRQVSGDWDLGKDGSLTGISTERGMMAVSKAVFPRRYKLRGEFEFPPNSSKKDMTVSFLFGCKDSESQDDALYFTMDRKAGTAALRRGPNGRVFFSRRMPVNARNVLVINIWDGEVTVNLNGMPLRAPLHVRFPHSPSAIGLAASGAPGLSVSFHELQLRKLDERPPR